MSVTPQVNEVQAASALSRSTTARHGILWALGAIFCWSQSSAIIKLSVQSIPWLTLALWTTTLSALCYLLAVIVTGRLAKLRQMTVKEVLTLAGIGVSGNFLYTCCIFAAYQRGPASEVLIVNYLWPVATVAFASLISRERPNARELGGLALAVLGVVCVATRGHFHLPQALDADLLAFCGAICYGLFSAAAKRISSDNILSLFIAFTSSALLFLLAVLLTRSTFRIAHPRTWALVGYYSVGVGAIPVLLWLKALQAQYTSRAAILIYLTPVLGLLWLKLLLPREQITWSVLGGLALIVGGFLLQFAKGISIRGKSRGESA